MVSDKSIRFARRLPRSSSLPVVSSDIGDLERGLDPLTGKLDSSEVFGAKRVELLGCAHNYQRLVLDHEQ